MKKAISYARFSSAIQADGSSESRQTDNFTTFCKTHQLEPIANFIDRGKSGFKFSAAERLKVFLDGAKAGAYPKGSVLVIEAIDRFSREDADDAYDTFKDICKTGIDIGVCEMGRVLTLADLKDLGTKITIIIKMCAANQFSTRLSGRMKFVKKQMRDNGVKTKCCPSWISLVDGSYILNEKASVLKQACIMSIAGHGATDIRKKLGFTGKTWFNLTGIFRERTLIGEFQPRIRQGKIKVDEGKAVEGYYPALLTLAEFRALQDALDSRINAKVARKEKCANLFNMLICAVDKSKLLVRPQRGGKVMLVSKDAFQGKGAYRWIDYDAVETHLLNMVHQHITPAMLNPVQAKIETEVEKVRAKMSDNESKMDKLCAMLEANPSDMVFNLIIKLEADQKALALQLDDLISKQAHNPADELNAAQDLSESLAGLEGAELLNTRIRLKALLGALIESVSVERRSDASDLSFVVRLKSGCTLEGCGRKWKTNEITFWEQTA